MSAPGLRSQRASLRGGGTEQRQGKRCPFAPWHRGVQMCMHGGLLSSFSPRQKIFPPAQLLVQPSPRARPQAGLISVTPRTRDLCPRGSSSPWWAEVGGKVQAAPLPRAGANHEPHIEGLCWVLGHLWVPLPRRDRSGSGPLPTPVPWGQRGTVGRWEQHCSR